MFEGLGRGLEFGEAIFPRQISFAGWRRQFRDRDFKQGYLGEEIENMHLCTLFISLSSVEKKIIFSMHNDLHFTQTWQIEPMYLHADQEWLPWGYNHLKMETFNSFVEMSKMSSIFKLQFRGMRVVVLKWVVPYWRTSLWQHCSCADFCK